MKEDQKELILALSIILEFGNPNINWTKEIYIS